MAFFNMSSTQLIMNIMKQWATQKLSDGIGVYTSLHTCVLGMAFGFMM